MMMMMMIDDDDDDEVSWCSSGWGCYNNAD